MSRAKALLDAATPLPWKWRIEDDVSGSAEVYASGDDYITYVAPEEAALIVYAVNRLPDYEAAVEALEHFVESWGGNYDPDGRLVDCEESYKLARAALVRLRDEVPA